MIPGIGAILGNLKIDVNISLTLCFGATSIPEVR